MCLNMTIVHIRELVDTLMNNSTHYKTSFSRSMDFYNLDLETKVTLFGYATNNVLYCPGYSYSTEFTVLTGSHQQQFSTVSYFVQKLLSQFIPVITHLNFRFEAQLPDVTRPALGIPCEWLSGDTERGFLNV